MAAKRPKGELPKRTSGYADYLKERRPNISKSAAAAQAGAVRAKGYDTSAFKKAASSTKLKKSNLDKTAGSRSKSGASTVAAVAKRFGVTAREARDIATAVGTLGKAVVTPGSNYGSQRKNKTATIVKTAGDIAKQAGETYTAATKGKSGTSAIKLNTRARNASGMPTDVEYKTGTKRKQGSKK